MAEMASNQHASEVAIALARAWWHSPLRVAWRIAGGPAAVLNTGPVPWYRYVSCDDVTSRKRTLRRWVGVQALSHGAEPATPCYESCFGTIQSRGFARALEHQPLGAPQPQAVSSLASPSAPILCAARPRRLAAGAHSAPRKCATRSPIPAEAQGGRRGGVAHGKARSRTKQWRAASARLASCQTSALRLHAT